MSRSRAAPGEGPAAAVNSGESDFELTSLERRFSPRSSPLAFRWRRRALVAAALVGCLALFLFARWLAATPRLPGEWAAGVHGELVLAGADGLAALQPQQGRALAAITAGGASMQPSALLLLRAPRWQSDDTLRAQQMRQQQLLAVLLQRAAGAGRIELRFADGASVAVPVAQRGYAGLGLAFWPLAALALLIYLSAVVVLLARAKARNLLFLTMSLCQAGNVLFVAVELLPGLGLPEAVNAAAALPLRGALDLATGAALVHSFLLHPLRFAHAGPWALALWTVTAMLWAALNADALAAPWATLQGACILLGLLALGVVQASYRREPNPYVLVMRRLGLASLVLLVLTSAAVAWRARLGAPALAQLAPTAWTLLFAVMLLLTPLLARRRQVLREFAMLAGISAVATALDLLFITVFSLGPFTSLALAVFVALGAYAAARQWLLHRFIGSTVLTTERTFDQLYRAARELQRRPARYTLVLAQVLRDLFEPLEVTRLDRVPGRARVIGGGSALVVPLLAAGDSELPPEDDAPSQPAGAPAIVLRFARRGQRLFMLEDARLADRIVDQLRRAVAYDQAVERGRHEERLRIAQDLHDDIGARLLTLMYQAPTPALEDYIRHTLQDLKTLTRGLAASEHRLSHAAAEWKADLVQRMSAARVALGWSVAADRDQILSMVQWSALTRVLRELVSNALYHGQPSRIDVQILLDGGELTLQVSDDGRGREPQTWSHGLGLGGVRKRVKLLGGEVTWQENLPRGIRCIVRVDGFFEQHPSRPPPA